MVACFALLSLFISSTNAVEIKVSENDPIVMAIDRDHVATVIRLMKPSYGAMTVISNRTRERLIVRAATHGSERVFHHFLKSMHGARTPAAVSDSRGTPLIILLASLANPSRPDHEKFERMIRVLLNDFPSTIHDRDRAYVGDGRSALHEAAALGNMRVIHDLVTHGASVSAKNATGETPLHLSSRFGRLDAVKYFLKRGAMINEKSRFTGATPLMYAAEMGHESVIRTLIDAGAEKSIRDTFGKTAPERFREYVASYQNSKKPIYR